MEYTEFEINRFIKKIKKELYKFNSAKESLQSIKKIRLDNFLFMSDTDLSYFKDRRFDSISGTDLKLEKFNIIEILQPYLNCSSQTLKQIFKNQNNSFRFYQEKYKDNEFLIIFSPDEFIIALIQENLIKTECLRYKKHQDYAIEHVLFQEIRKKINQIFNKDSLLTYFDINLSFNYYGQYIGCSFSSQNYENKNNVIKINKVCNFIDNNFDILEKMTTLQNKKNYIFDVTINRDTVSEDLKCLFPKYLQTLEQEVLNTNLKPIENKKKIKI